MPKKASPAAAAKLELESLLKGGLLCKEALEHEVEAFAGKSCGARNKGRLERKALRNGYESSQVRSAEGRIELEPGSQPCVLGGARHHGAGMSVGLGRLGS